MASVTKDDGKKAMADEETPESSGDTETSAANAGTLPTTRTNGRRRMVPVAALERFATGVDAK